MLDMHLALLHSCLDCVLKVFVHVPLTELALHIVYYRHDPVYFCVENFALLETIKSYALLHSLLFGTRFIRVHQR
jgi:hypothetical protein